MKSRQDRIKFLKGLTNGTRSINELRPSRSIYLIRIDGETIAREQLTGKEWTQSDIEEHHERHPQDHIVVIVLTEG
jgi:hypothetical protein